MAGCGVTTAARGSSMPCGGGAQLEDAREVTLSACQGEERERGARNLRREGRLHAAAPRPGAVFVQRLRDEAHRLRIGTHRPAAQEGIIKNPLDEIEGIGPTRKRALRSIRSARRRAARRGGPRAAIQGISKRWRRWGTITSTGQKWACARKVQTPSATDR